MVERSPEQQEARRTELKTWHQALGTIVLPEACSGCEPAMLRRVHFANKVAKEDLPLDAAQTALTDELAACPGTSVDTGRHDAKPLCGNEKFKREEGCF